MRDQVPSSSSRTGGMREKVGEIPGVKAIAIKAIALTQNEDNKKFEKLK